MKVEKQELSTLTEEAVKVCIVALTGLLQSECPHAELYRVIEKFAIQIDRLRLELQLASIVPEELSSGWISKTVAEGGHINLEVQAIRVPNDKSKMN